MLTVFGALCGKRRVGEESFFGSASKNHISFLLYNTTDPCYWKK
jgi:hypothetical protein